MAKLSRKRAESVALWGLLVQILFGVITFVLAGWARSDAAFAAGWQLFMGAPFWLVCYLHVRIQRLAEEEEVDWQRLLAEREQQGGRGTLFEVEEGEAFVMRSRLKKMENFWLPAASILMLLAMGGLAYVLFGRILPYYSRIAVENVVLASGLLAIQAILCFLFAMYANGMAREKVWQNIRAGSTYLMYCAAGLALTVVGLLAAYFRYPIVEFIVACVIAGSLAVLAVEMALNFVINIYRPRAPGTEIRYAHESRLLELLSHPGSILHTAAATLDYQFGFKVSDTWFYRFMERAILPIVLFGFISFYLLTTMVIVAMDERVIVERFGNPVDAQGQPRILEPGFHFKWPWPIDRIRRMPATRVQKIMLGHVGAEVDERARLWTRAHYEQEYEFLVAMDEDQRERAEEVYREEAVAVEEQAVPPPVNLLATTISIHYRIRPDNESLFNYVYSVIDTQELIRALGYREATKYLSNVDLFKVMGEERQQAGDDLKELIQTAVDRENLGIEIIFCGLLNIHPPVDEEVGASFEQVIAAQQEMEAAILQARGTAFELEEMSQYEARSIRSEAEAYRFRQASFSEAEAERFGSQLEAYNKAPGVYETRLFLDHMEESLKEIRKYVIVAQDWEHAVIQLNLEEAIRPGLLDVEVGGN